MQSDTAATLMRDPTVDSGGRWQIKKMTVLYSLIHAASETCTHILHALIFWNICPAVPFAMERVKSLVENSNAGFQSFWIQSHKRFGCTRSSSEQNGTPPQRNATQTLSLGSVAP